MEKKILVILNHNNRGDDLQYIKKMISVPNLKLKILILSASYLSEVSSIYDKLMFKLSWERAKIVNPELVDIKNIAEANKNPLEIAVSENLKGGSNTKWGEVMSELVKNVDLVVNRYQYVADAVSEGYQIIKW